ncbi:MAG TPA: beta-N-acetylhexosaminidase [Candidatus Nitrosotenuis sp.]|nr:beta-N-acetylhexosaminidase [Candidatus Nitrosotenuis sp.]
MTHGSQLDREVLSHFLLGFEGTSLSAAFSNLLARGLGGVAIYPRNFDSPVALRKLIDEIRAAACGPVLIGIDQEGGTKFSLPEPFTQWPSPAQLGAIGDAALVQRVAESMARELRAVGVNLNFAPMLDLHVHAESPVTRGRSFGSQPDVVAKLGVACIEGLWKRGGVLACAKHFPGHGDAQVDPHEDLPVIRGDAERLATAELVPFDAAIAAGVPLIMTAHIVVMKIDAVRPATLSSPIVTTLLRERMGFQGVIVADDLGMGAIRKQFPHQPPAALALRAGADLLMLCHDWNLVEPALESVQLGLRQGWYSELAWQASLARLEKIRESLSRMSTAFSQESLDCIGGREHRELAAQVLARAAQQH